MNVDNLMPVNVLYSDNTNPINNMQGSALYYKLLKEDKFLRLQEVLIEFHEVCEQDVVYQRSGQFGCSFSLLTILYVLSGRSYTQNFAIVESTELNKHKHEWILRANKLLVEFIHLQREIVTPMRHRCTLYEIVADTQIVLPAIKQTKSLTDSFGAVLSSVAAKIDKWLARMLHG